MSLLMLGGFSVDSSLSKNYNFAVPRVLNTHFEFENGPVSRDEKIMQYYHYGRFPREGVSTSFCCVKIQDEIFILGGNQTNRDNGIQVWKMERNLDGIRNLRSEKDRFLPTRHQIVVLDWKLPLPFVKHVCSAVKNFEIWLGWIPGIFGFLNPANETWIWKAQIGEFHQTWKILFFTFAWAFE